MCKATLSVNSQNNRLQNTPQKYRSLFSSFPHANVICLCLT